MQCPTCTNTALVMAERQGVEIDYCPKCRGVWLDRGELDKLIERSSPMAPAHSSAAQSQPHFADSDYEHRRGPQGNRKRSWLSDIFD